MRKISLSKIDPGATEGIEDKEEAQIATHDLLEKLYKQLYLMYAGSSHSLLVILQGIDAAGKDGIVRSLFSGANPQGIRVYSFKKPTEDELRHDMFWRCHKHSPARGFAAIFNRSYYEEVSTVKVHPEMLVAQNISPAALKDKKFFERRFRQINEFEQMLSESGTLVLKFFLHISKSEQKKRLLERIEDPTKHWKFSAQDLEERKFWSSYMKAFEEMLNATNTKHAPWQVIPADRKWFRNYAVAKTVVSSLESLKMEFPKVKIDGKHRIFL